MLQNRKLSELKLIEPCQPRVRMDLDVVADYASSSAHRRQSVRNTADAVLLAAVPTLHGVHCSN